MDLCKKELPVRGKYKDIAEKKCYREDKHEGGCKEFPYLSDLSATHPRVANKIKRDATKTTGAPEFDSYRRNYLILLEAVLKIATTARRAAPAVVVL